MSSLTYLIQNRDEVNTPIIHKNNIYSLSKSYTKIKQRIRGKVLVHDSYSKIPMCSKLTEKRPAAILPMHFRQMQLDTKLYYTLSTHNYISNCTPDEVCHDFDFAECPLLTFKL